MQPLINRPPDVLTNTVTPYRREGHAELLRLSIDGGPNVSFAPGQYRAQLEISLPNAKSPILLIPSQIGADPTLAVMAIPPAELAQLRAGTYERRVILTAPDGAVTVLVDGLLSPR